MPDGLGVGDGRLPADVACVTGGDADPALAQADMLTAMRAPPTASAVRRLAKGLPVPFLGPSRCTARQYSRHREVRNCANAIQRTQDVMLLRRGRTMRDPGQPAVVRTTQQVSMDEPRWRGVIGPAVASSDAGDCAGRR